MTPVGKTVFFLLFLSSCSIVPREIYDERLLDFNTHRELVIWMLSDIQPEDKQGRTIFEKAIEDVNTSLPGVNFAVVAGDLLKSRSQRESFEWFVSTRNRSLISNWFEIAGNHDVRSGDIFRQYIKKPPHYGVMVGNVLLLLISDESTDSKTDISDAVFNWWRDAVIRNQEKLILTVTHAPLASSGLFSSGFKSRRIDNSERFDTVLKESKVAIWASGHSHLPQGMAGTVSINPDLGGTFFVNVSAIREDYFMDSQSRFFIFEEGSDIVWIRSRNHTEKRFDPHLDIPLKLDRPFIWDGSDPRLVLHP